MFIHQRTSRNNSVTRNISLWHRPVVKFMALLLAYTLLNGCADKKPLLDLPPLNPPLTQNFVVTSTATNDDGTCDADCSLIEALRAADYSTDASIITFDDFVFATPQTIEIDGRYEPLDQETDIDIQGPGAGLLTVKRYGDAVFSFSSDKATISGLTINGGDKRIVNRGKLTVSNCIIRGSVSGISAMGTGIDNDGTMTINNSTIIGAEAGILNWNRGTMTLNNSTISANSGGAVFSSGIYNTGSLEVTSSTISGNRGGNITNMGTLTLHNSIVTQNVTEGVDNDIVGVVEATSSYNLIGNGHGLSGISNGTNGNKIGTYDTPLDAKLGALTYNGGPTLTMKLLVGSPAINGGDPAFDGTGKFDQRGNGFLRVADGRLDIGAYELAEYRQTGPNYIVNTTDDNDDSVCGVVDCSLREAIFAANSNADASILTFTVGLTGTINLTGALPVLNTDIDIQGPGANVLDVHRSTGGDYSVFVVSSIKTVSISGLTLSNGNGNYGGGIENSGFLLVKSCTLNNNRADNEGGGIFNGGELRVESSTLNNNSAVYGGGIANGAFAALTVNNSTISGNTTTPGFSGEGGGISNYAGGTLTVTNSTITGNTCSDSGGGIANYPTSEGYGNTVTLHNTIVALNTSGAGFNGPDIADDVQSSSSYNLIGDGMGMTGISNGSGGNQIGTSAAPIDPKLGPLAGNGGPTKTHALLTGSPALNTGDPAFDGTGQFDQRGTGFPREAAGRLDIGAFELSVAAPLQQRPPAALPMLLPEESVNQAPQSAPSQIGATFVVTKTDDHDDGVCNTDCTLREAINAVNTATGDDTITFDATVFASAKTINLLTELPTLNSNIDIQGPGARLLDVHRNSADEFVIFSVLELNTVTLGGMTISNGLVGDLSGMAGGGVGNMGTLTINNCTISGNAAIAGAGIGNAGTLTVNNCTISGNTATLGGAGIGNAGTATINNSTISGNSASTSTGGVANLGTLTVTNSTIIKNIGGFDGGITNTGSLTLHNSIVAQNTGTRSPDISGLVKTTSTFNIVGTGTGLRDISNTNGNQIGTDAALLDPKLGPLANNGGPTQTHALLSGSPALDKGDAAFNGTGKTDQRGSNFPRVQGTHLDIGAFEAPTLSINDVTIAEGPAQGAPAGTKTATFTVTLSSSSTQTVTVKYATANGTTNPATAGSDYVALPLTTLTFTAGQTSKTVNVTINGDTTIEPNETFFVNLSAAANATIADARGIGTITNDDLPSLSINDMAFLEGNSGLGSVNFTVTLSQAFTQTVTVKYATANATAIAPGDYTTTTGTLTIPAGQTKGIIAVPIVGDTLDELEEWFFVNLSAATNATISDTQGRAIIIDNDAAPTLSINDITITEGTGTNANATFTVTLSAPSGKTVSVNAITANGTARAPGDYTSAGSTLTFSPGQTTKTFSVSVAGDSLDEENETLFVLLSSPVNTAVARGRGLCTIADNDAPPTISIDDVSIKEYNGGQSTGVVLVRLSAPSGKAVKVTYATAVGTINPATAGNDYVAVPSTQITFDVGRTVTLARVLINGDLLNEPNETFLVNLSSPINGTIADSQALGTVLNDDSAPALSINDVSIAEGHSGTKLLTFIVTLSKASGQTVSVNYASANGTATTANSDYVAKTGSLSFAPGSALTRTISITINGDTLSEGNETLFVFLSGATNGSISKARGVGTITNDDTSG